jgi:diguanylate cyclase
VQRAQGPGRGSAGATDGGYARRRGLLAVAGKICRVYVLVVAFDFIVDRRFAATYFRTLLQVASVLAGIVLISEVRTRLEDRRAWTALTVGVWLQIVPDVIGAARSREPIPPTILDVMYLLSYVVMLVGLVPIVRRRLPSVGLVAWLDGLGIFFGGGALVMATVLRPMTHASNGSNAATVVTLVYPILDIMIAGVLVTVCTMLHWSFDRAIAVLCASFALFSVIDFGYSLLYAYGDYSRGSLLDVGWTISYLLVAIGSLLPVSAVSAQRPTARVVAFVPSVSAVIALGVLLSASYNGTKHNIHPVAPALSAVALLAAVGRVVVAARQSQLLDATRTEARTDELTGLPNRRRMNEVLAAALAGHPSQSLALLVVDLDRFKEVNDSLGHDVGDDILRAFGPRLATAVGTNGEAFRLGGDEFAVIAPGAAAVTAVAIARSIQGHLAEPLELVDHTFSIVASVGIAVAPWHGRTSSDLFRAADTAMYEAKRRGRGPVVYDSAWDTNSPARVERLSQLRAASFADELIVAFQPILDTSTRRLVGAEALVRWDSPDHGVLAPASFLELTAQAGRATDLTAVVLDRALEACAIWRRTADLTVSVNIASADVGDVSFLGRIGQALERYGLPPEALVLEVPETMFGDELAMAHRFFRALRSLGVGLSIDDYGSGVAGIGQLARLPATELKIDRSLVTGLLGDRRNEAIVRSTIELARSLGLVVVAEGVEDLMTFDHLAELGCHRVQGFGIGRETTVAGIAGLSESFPLQLR